MKIVTMEVRLRLDPNESEAKALMHAKHKVMDVPGALSVIQIGPVDDTSKTEWLDKSKERRMKCSGYTYPVAGDQ